MKNSKLVKIVLVVIINFSILLVAKDVLATTDLTSTLTGSNSVGNNSAGDNLVTISGNNTTTNNTVLKTNNTSNYNNTSLPNTGIESSVPSMIILVVLGISSVYAYKKIQDYKNI